jgi:CHAD domain-containing protein
MLPGLLANGIDPLFRQLADERQTEFKKVSTVIKSQNTRNLLKEWEKFLNDRNLEQSPDAEIAIYAYSKGIIKERLNKILKRGNKLLQGKPKDEALHRLRIDCKKLRYLLEFFSSLYSSEEINVLVKHLKTVQNLLGDFNDLSVQIDDLLNRLSELSVSRKESIVLAAAFGGLLTHFRQKQQVLKDNFKSVFEDFSDKSHLEIYFRLFF